jgi:hypothetical protein
VLLLRARPIILVLSVYKYCACPRTRSFLSQAAYRVCVRVCVCICDCVLCACVYTYVCIHDECYVRTLCPTPIIRALFNIIPQRYLFVCLSTRCFLSKSVHATYGSAHMLFVVCAHTIYLSPTPTRIHTLSLAISHTV